MKAVIMAGGEGTRLRPLTCGKPKPMVSVAGKPVMEYTVELLKNHGITDIAVTLQYLPQEIIDYFGDGKEFGVNIKYYIEHSPLGTAGSVKNAEDFLDDDFIIISGDALTDINLTEAIRFHNEKNSTATLVLYRIGEPLEYGVVVTRPDGKIERFLEKPDWSEVFSDTVNTGIYILNPKVLNLFNKNEFYDFGKDLFPKLMEQREPMFGYVADSYWCDIGDIDAYIQCHRDVLNNKVNLHFDATFENGIWKEKNVTVMPGAIIKPPAFIGEGTRIASGAKIGPYSVIGKNSNIKSDCSIKYGILWNNVSISPYAEIRGAVLCDKVSVGEASSIYENTIVGSKTKVGSHVNISPNIKIWPQKTIDNGNVINGNLVWGSKPPKKLFCERGICGEVNVDITPEFAGKLGAAFGALFKGGKVGLAFDASNATEMLTSATAAGLLSAGSQVYDFGEQLLPITRSAVRFYGLDGGIHLSVYKTDNEYRLNIDLLDKDGCNLTRDAERKLESLFIREDFTRSESQNIKSVMKLENYKYFYLRDIINSLKSSRLNGEIILQTLSDTVYELMDLILNDCGSCLSENNFRAEFTSEISKNGENLILHTRSGDKINTDQFLALTALILIKENPKSTVVLPQTAPKMIEDMVKQAGGTVVYSKTSTSELMKEIMTHGTNTQFKLLFDGVYASVKILDFLTLHNLSLEQLLNQIPAFYKCEIEVECPDRNKGFVIKELISQYKNDPMELSEGVKIFKDGGWALVIPHNQRSVCRIITEGANEEFAEELTDIFKKEVKRLAKQL